VKRWLLLLLLLGTGRLRAGAWSLDVGLAAGIGASGFVGQPAGQDPSTFFSPPTVQASSSAGLLGSAGLDLSLQRKRRWGLNAQVLWEGHSLTMTEDLDFGGGTTLQRQTLWEWQDIAFPLSLSYAHPIWTRENGALLVHGALGVWWAQVQARHKSLSSGVGAALDRPWDGPSQDWGPLAALGLDWLSLPSGRRTVSFEVRATRGTAGQDPGAGADLPVWGLQGVLSIPIWMKVL
jgi:hypothetical protein